MAKAGVISLLDKNGEVVSVKKYVYSFQRKTIIENWRRQYAAAMDGCSIQIAPETDETAICPKTGSNIRKQHEPFTTSMPV